MSDPATEAGSGLADATGNSISIVGGAVVDSLLTTLGVMGPALAGAAVVAVVIASFVIVGRIRTEAALGRRSLDPRPLVDPTASDVLGEW